MAVTNLSEAAERPLTVWLLGSCNELWQPKLPGTSMRTPGTMKTSGERRGFADT
jgi:hypothetical protein